MYGRSDRYYVKQFEEETNLRAYLLVDVSGSMGWTSAPGVLPPKLWYAKHLAASLALILLRQGDAVGPIDLPRPRQPEHRAPRRPAPMARAGAQAGPVQSQGATSAQSVLHDLAARLHPAGLVVLLSDLLVDPETTGTALRYLRHQGHEVLVFHLMDPGERELPATPDARFFDPETEQELHVTVADVREEYRTAVRRALREWERSMKPHGIDYLVLDTDEPLSRPLREYLRKRERLG